MSVAHENCPKHQTWDFDCPTCVKLAARRVSNYKRQARREILDTFGAPAIHRPQVAKHQPRVVAR